MKRLLLKVRWALQRERVARFEHEARMAMRDWLMV
jgi:hypothetical protein